MFLKNSNNTVAYLFNFWPKHTLHIFHLTLVLTFKQYI